MGINDVTVVREQAATQRKIRAPKHKFNVAMKPWVIQPMMIAPVLPGETLKQMLFQGTARSDALKSDQLGWWFENFYFYVKHRDLKERDVVTEMHLNPAADVSSLMGRATHLDENGQLVYDDTGDPVGPGGSTGGGPYAYGGAIDWVKLCLDCVTDEYFRDEGEATMIAAIDSLPMASVNEDTWLDSVILASQAPEADELIPGEVQQMPDQGIPPGFEAAYAQWQHMRALNLYTATFEDYLKSFGVKPAKELEVNEIHRPELIRYVRDWGYPQVKYDTTSASAAPQMIWNVTERADKDRFFSEPGFIFGVCVARPKLYHKQAGPAVGVMNNAYAWLPAVLDDAPYTSLMSFEANTGPLGATINEKYWIDVKDIFMHGDQFIGHSANPENALGLIPTFPNVLGGKFNRRFVTEAEAAGFFSNPANTMIRYEGVVSLSIASKLRDTTL